MFHDESSLYGHIILYKNTCHDTPQLTNVLIPDYRHIPELSKVIVSPSSMLHPELYDAHSLTTVYPPYGS